MREDLETRLSATDRQEEITTVQTDRLERREDRQVREERIDR